MNRAIGFVKVDINALTGHVVTIRAGVGQLIIATTGGVHVFDACGLHLIGLALVMIFNHLAICYLAAVDQGPLDSHVAPTNSFSRVEPVKSPPAGEDVLEPGASLHSKICRY